MTEELGVLVAEGQGYVHKYDYAGFNVITEHIENARHITRKESEKFPQFEWVALSELEVTE